MATVSSFSHFTNSNFRPPQAKIPLQPRLFFAKSISNSLRPYPFRTSRPNRRNPVASQPNPRSRIAKCSFRPGVARLDFACFRCGEFGHLAKECRTPARCFACGAFGHKKINCVNLIKVVAAPLNSVDLGCVKEDDGWIIRKVLEPEADFRVDPMLFDPDVFRGVSFSKVEDMGFYQSLTDEDSMDEPNSELKEPATTELPRSQVSVSWRSNYFRLVPGMVKGFVAHAVARLGKRSSFRRLYNKKTRPDLVAKTWYLPSMMGNVCAFRPIKVNGKDEILADSPLQPGLATSFFSKETASAFYDFPTIEEDSTSVEKLCLPNFLAYKQVELNLEPTPLEDSLDFEVIDDDVDFHSGSCSKADSPIKPAPAQPKIAPSKPQSLPMKSKRVRNMEHPAAVRRSPRFCKGTA